MDAGELKKVPEKMKKLRNVLEEHRDELAEKNDTFAATREFLEKRGLESTRNLDAEGRKALLEYLGEAIKNSLRDK